MIREADLRNLVRKHSDSAAELAKELLMHDAHLVDDYIVMSNGVRRFLVDLQEREPSRLAEFLVLLCVKKRYSGAILSDLEEVFERDLDAGMSLRRARIRFWGRALHSVAPQLWALAKRVGLVGILVDYARRLLH